MLNYFVLVVMKKSLLILIAFFCAYSAKSQVYIDTVLSLKPGTVQNAGQDSESFPMNIFGPPSALAKYTVPASDPKDICSIGLDGEIIVGNKSHYIIDGPGPDFTIFENAFMRLADSMIFAEPGIVSVSENGIDFIEFPYDSISLEGCAGVGPTNGDKDPFNPSESGGNSFDLASIGLSKAKYIKIKDITRVVTYDTKHKYYSPLFIVSGFDLDAIAIINSSKINSVNDLTNIKYIDTDDYFKLITESPVDSYEIFNINSNRISFTNNDYIFINKHNLTQGIYFLRANISGQILTYKFLVLR